MTVPEADKLKGPIASDINGSGSDHPPSYSLNESITLELAKLNLAPSTSDPLSSTVTPDQCVAHLKFLAVLADLRETISNKDGLFQIFDVDATNYPDALDRAQALIREKRWAVYTARAADRYTKWWFEGLPKSRPSVTQTDLDGARYERIVDGFGEIVDFITWTVDNLPPLDILMVWHSHMLNPRNYLEDCIRYGRLSAWRTGFPFEEVNNHINDNLEYVVSQQTKDLFENKIKIKWDNLLDPSTKDLECPRCEKKWVQVEWTGGDVIGDSLEDMFQHASGYADKSFKATCKDCKSEFGHGLLRVAKFRKDALEVLDENKPMPGSLLSINGMPENQPPGDKAKSFRPTTFPTRLIRALGRQLITDYIGSSADIDGIRACLEIKLEDRWFRFKIHELSGPYKSPIRGGEKVFLRRMMAHYWDNSSPFSLDLVGAVIRQGTFVQKMDNIDWLHSPTVMETARRLIAKYEVFMKIMLTNPRNMAVPTLDVDLAWHTHQMCPSRYYEYTTAIEIRGIRQFVNHDDKIDENRLSEAFEWTSKMYRRATNGGIYSECTCWYCEAVRVPDLYGRIFSIGSSTVARNSAESLHTRQDISSDPDKNPHISAHNAVRPTFGVSEGDKAGLLQRLRLQKNYEKLLRRSEKQGVRRKDTREKTDQHGVVLPYYYAPYMCDPGIHSSAYVCNPSLRVVLVIVAKGHAEEVLQLARVVVWVLLAVVEVQHVVVVVAVVEGVEDVEEGEGVEVGEGEEVVDVVSYLLFPEAIFNND
ncbi:hypothetical protein N7495_001321 [Penicillium taxi]|uniref:uncharacterized protein n=1 Tax=Penicillium taxi TaxID=168475 RepID=UPI002544E1FE|nr:uncharacterized protein N7495_001321 [Penicillium taxi]KAJ5908639.1 hypothetical protein N7495_001321 [Penicillium taxi]